MKSIFTCNIVSTDEEIFSGKAEMVVATGVLGEIGIYQGHAPFLTKLKPGHIKIIKHGGVEELFYISGGFLEVQPYSVLVLADTAIRANDLDEIAVQEALKEAQKLMNNQKSDFEYSAASAKLAEISAQLNTIHKIRQK